MNIWLHQKKVVTLHDFPRKSLIFCENTLNYTMKKTILLLGCTLLFASSVFSANLNVYASGLKVMGMTDDRQLSISYFLNAPADEVVFLLVDKMNPTSAPYFEVQLPSKSAGENSAVVNLFGIDVSRYTWGIKASCNTANATTVLVRGGYGSSEEKFQFYTPAGLAVDNNPNSPYFGRIYISESRNGASITVNGASKTSEEGVYLFNPDLSGGDTPYTGGVSWNQSLEKDNAGPYDMYGPARLAIDEEGFVYVCDNGPVSHGTSGVWRMNPASPDSEFDDVLNTFKDGQQQNKRGVLYNRINSAVVIGGRHNKKLVAIDNTSDDKPNMVSIPLEIDENVYPDAVSSTVLRNVYEDKIVNSHNTIVRGIHGDYWVFQYRSKLDDYPPITHYNSNYERDFYVDKDNELDGMTGVSPNLRGSGALSPDGSLLAFNTTDGLFIYNVSYGVNNKPSLTLNEHISNFNNQAFGNVDGIAFDVAGNLYFASARCERFYVCALKKQNNTHTTIAPSSQKIPEASPRIRMMAYNLRLTVADDKYNFSFYANSKPLAGNLFIYSDKELTHKVHTVALFNLNQGKNNVSVDMDDLSHNDGKDLYWAVELTGEQNPVFGEVYRQDESLNRAYAVIDNNPESNFFGRIYVANRIEGKDDEMYVLDYDYSYLVKKSPIGTYSAGRPAVDSEGFVYWADYGDTGSGIMIMDPSTFVTNQFFQGEKNNKGVWINNSVAVGSSTPGVYVYGTGSDTKLYMVNEDALGAHAPYSYCVYNIGQGDGTILRTWGTAPSKTVAITDNDGQNFSIVATTHGVFLCQNRELNMNKQGAYSLQFYDNKGVRRYVSDGKALIINGSYGGGMAISRDESQLAMVNGVGGILLFDIVWNGDTPGLTINRTYETDFSAISTIHFDYAGNLVVTTGTGYGYNHVNDLRLVVYSQPTNDNTIIVPAPSSQRIPALVLDEKRDNSTALAAAKATGEQMSTVRVLRSLAGGMYNTVCLPFNASLTEGPLAGARAYTFSGSSKTEGGDILLHFSEAYLINAGIPYLVEPQEDIASPMDFNNVTITTLEGGSTGSGNITFKGILAPQELTQGNKSILFLVSDNKLAWANTTANMNGMRAYFSLPEGAYDQLRTSARIVTSESGTTDIQQTSTQANTQKIMQNGRLYIRKDGQIYTILGRKVK